MNSIILSAEDDLRTTGTLRDATCQAFMVADDETRRGLEPSFSFLGCSSKNATNSDIPVPALVRVAAVRLMMLRLGLHTETPRWSSRVLENLIDAALQPPGALIGDVVRALFVLLAEAPPGLSDAQANVIREISIHVVGKQRRRYAAEDFSWFADKLGEPNSKTTAAQAYLAAYTLPPELTSRCHDLILQALRSTSFEEEVRRELE